MIGGAQQWSNPIFLDTELSKYYMWLQMAVARGLGGPSN